MKTVFYPFFLRWSFAQAFDLPDDQAPNTIRFSTFGGKCGANNEDAYVGTIEPAIVNDEDSFFVELMGGAVCFNYESCNEEWLGAWMSIDKFLSQKMNMNENEIFYFKTQDVPLSFFADTQPGYVPASEGHPLYGQRGIYYPTCTGDVMMGRHTLLYEDPDTENNMTARHHGAVNLQKVLLAVKASYPNLKKFTIYGGSGGAVSASIWGFKVAEMFPQANVHIFSDSGFHMMPGSAFFKYFWANVSWSTGPGGENNGMVGSAEITDEQMPTWDWRETLAVSKQLTEYEGRVKIAFLACSRDKVVESDREKMGQFSDFDRSNFNQLQDMWGYVRNLHKCAPDGTVFSYISDCELHHASRAGFSDDAINLPGHNVTAQAFVDGFLSQEPLCGDGCWYEVPVTDGGMCTATPEQETSGTLFVGALLPMLSSLVVQFAA